MLSNKEKTVLEFFINNKGQSVTSKKVADELKVSDRTIRNYIKLLQDVLIENGAEIIAKQGQGYTLKVENELSFNTFLQKNNVNSIKKSELDLYDSKDRQYYILNKLLFEDQKIFFDDLCEELFVSRSTISSDFSEIRNFLKPYNLSVISKAKIGVYVEGDERNKRHFIMDYFFGNTFNISINKYVGNTLFFNDVSFEEITIIVLDECREAGLRLSDYVIQNLVLHIALAIKRIKDGFKLSIAEVDKSIEKRKEFLVGKRILKRITNSNNIEFPNEEAYYIALHLTVKSTIKSEDENSESDEKDKIQDELIEILEKIEIEKGYKIKNDKQLINGVLTHFCPLIMRLKYNVTIENPLLNEIKEKYYEVFDLTKEYLSNMTIFKGYEIPDSEWAYICLHFMAAIERYKDNKKLNVLVICATGYGSGQMLNIRLKKEFGQHINIVDVIGYYEITDEILKDIDLIISSIDLFTVVFNVPVIHVSVFLNEKEINTIRCFIEKGIYNNPNDEKLFIESEKEVLFNEFFKEDCFLKIDKSISKDKVIENLLGSIQKYEEDDYFKIMIRQIAQREYMSSVVFSNEIAVPHPAKSVGETARVAVALINDGVYWDDEFRNIKFVFLLSPSKFENKNLNNITKAIVELTENKDIQNQLLKSKNFDEFRKVFVELI